MKKITFIIVSLFISTGALAQPKVLCLIVVDQLQADYMSRFERKFKSGFSRLQARGTYFSNHYLSFIPTSTSPGHATLMTGQTPRVHGIVGNFWWDREKKKKVYSIPPSQDVSNLLSPTFGDQFKEINPDARIVSFSLKDRSAVLMAGKQAELALWFDKRKGKFVSSPSYPSLPEWVETFNRDMNVFPSDRSLIRSPFVTEKFLASPQSDQELFKVVQKFFNQSDFGRDDRPGLFMVSFSGTDYVGHRHGPFSREMEDQLMSLDGILGDLFAMLDDKIGKDNYVTVLTSDHGVMVVPDSTQGEEVGARHIHKKGFVEEVERAIQALFPVPGEQWLVHFQPPSLYFNRKLVDTMNLNWNQFLNRVALALDQMGDIAYVYNPSRAGLGDKYKSFFVEGTHPDRSGDLLIRMHKYSFVKPYFVVTGHGSPYDYDTHIPLFFMGPNINKMTLTQKTKLIDVAPTMAAMLGIELKEKLPGTNLAPLFLK